LINRASGFVAANGSAPSISILIPIPMRRSRTGTDLQFVFGQALRWLRGDIEGRAESRCVEVDVEVIDARVDVIDQGSEHSTLACCRQLGPALSALRGSRGQPLLH